MTDHIRRYAEGTEVPVEKSKADVERLLVKHGATGFVSSWDSESGRSVLIFKLRDRMLKYALDYPASKDIDLPKRGSTSSRAAATERKLEAEWRRRWRSVFLIIKAKLEIVFSGDSDLDREFLANIMLPNGTTMGEAVIPKLQSSYDSGKMPKLLLPGEIA